MDHQVGQTSQVEPAPRGDRVARTREAIIAATLTLAMEGEVAPIVRDIAQLAGVSARTVFQHFSDTAELYVAVLGRVLIALTADLPEAGLGWPLERRIDVIADVFAMRFEHVLPMWPFLQALQQRSAEAAGLIVGMYGASRTRLGQWFLQELTVLSAAARERTLNALCMSLAPEGWVVLRQRLALGVDDARDEWRFMLKAMLNEESAKR
jgi:AcrR family transcriptional regulator